MIKLFSFLVLFSILSCAGYNTNQKVTQLVRSSYPRYVFQDEMGNLFNITPAKLEYTPVSEENSVDGIKDQGYHTLINLDARQFQIISNLFEDNIQKEESFVDLENYEILAQPYIEKLDSLDSSRKQINLRQVQALNHILEPYIK